MKRLISLTLSICMLMSLSSCAKSESESTKAAPKKVTEDTTIEYVIESTILTSETKNQAGKPVVVKAVGEYDSYNNCQIYKPENVEIVPGTDYRDYTFKDLTEIKKHFDGDYPGGFLNAKEWLEAIGIDAADIDTSDYENLIIKNNNGFMISVGVTGISYSFNGNAICRYESGKATTKNNRVFIYEETPDKKFSYVVTASAETVDVLEVFANAYLAESTEDPLANVK